LDPISVAFDMTFPNRHGGGTGVYARRLVEALRKRSDVCVWETEAPTRPGPVGTGRWLLSGARRALDAHRPALLHCPSFVAPWSAAVPFVVTVHDAAARRHPSDHPLEWRIYDRTLMPGRLRAAARIIAVSEFARREIVDVYGLRPERVVAVPHGVDPRYFDQVSGRDRGHSDLLFPGAPVGRKNLEAVLECMAHASAGSRLERASLAITGARAEEFPNHVRTIRSLGLGTRVRWLGKVPSDDMPRLLAGATVVVYPSLYEGFGLPPLEAMAVGTPVVASNRTSLPEVLGDAALQVDPTDRRALGEALEAVLARPEVREELRERGRSWARGFSWDRCAELTRDVYREVLREEGGP
jgi:glycosyltransferase involved in cell wall biosynthesis